MAQKCPTAGQNAIFRQPIEIFLPKFHDLRQKEFSAVLENSTEIFSCSKLQLLQYFILYYKITHSCAICQCCSNSSLVSVLRKLCLRFLAAAPICHPSTNSAKYRPRRLVVDAALRPIGKSRHGGHKIPNISVNCQRI